MASKKAAWEATSWDELKGLVTLDVALKALKAREDNRLAHKRQYLKKQAKLEAYDAAVAAGKLKPVDAD